MMTGAASRRSLSVGLIQSLVLGARGATAMEPAAYPRELEGDISLADGTIVHVRPIRPSDQAGLMEFSRRLSAETVYLRFFRRLPALPPEWAHHFANVD